MLQRPEQSSNHADPAEGRDTCYFAELTARFVISS